MSERWLVTGGCGFVGANLLRRLAREPDVSVRVLDDLSLGRPADVEGLHDGLVRGDIRDADVVRDALADVDVIVHLAAHTRVVESIADPWENFDVNARGTLTLLDAARRSGRVRRFVLASTGGAILGDAEPPVHEGMPARPLSPYGASKLACEGYASAYAGAYGLATVALRFANVYGPWSYQKGSAVAVFMKRVQFGEPLVIYGDGQQTRDFLYVGDLCDAVVAAVRRPCAGEVFHIASGVETTITDLAAAVGRVSGRPVEVRYEPERRGEVRRNCARVDHAAAVLGWRPQTALAEGLVATWRWFEGRRTSGEVR